MEIEGNWITPSMIDAATTILNWAREYISKPHPDLGRPGPICPFVPPSIEKDLFYMKFHYEIEGTDFRRLKKLLLHYTDIFLRECPMGDSEQSFKSLLLIFPQIPDERATILDDVHALVKSDFVEDGL